MARNVGIAGLMGAGRTEFAMQYFLAALRCACISGKLFKDGSEIKVKSVSDAIKNGIAYATGDQQYGLNSVDDIRHNVATAGLFSSPVDDIRNWPSPPTTRNE